MVKLLGQSESLALVRQSERNVTAPTVSYAADKREGGYVPGSGRGSQKKCNADQATLDDLRESPTKLAKGLLDTDCRDADILRAALSSTVDYALNLKRQLGIPSSKLALMSRWLAASANIGPKPEEHHLLFKEMIGKGYPADTGRTLRRHKQVVMNCLQDVCGDDKLKQFELSCAVTDLFRQGISKKKVLKDSAATDSILKGLEATFALIAERSSGTSGRGRHKLNDRIVREVLTTAIMMAVHDHDTVTLSSIRRALGEKVDWRALEAGRERAEAYRLGEGSVFNMKETSCGAYPEEWDAFVTQCWMCCTRESERKSDEMLCRKENRWYRAHQFLYNKKRQ